MTSLPADFATTLKSANQFIKGSRAVVAVGKLLAELGDIENAYNEAVALTATAISARNAAVEDAKESDDKLTKVNELLSEREIQAAEVLQAARAEAEKMVERAGHEAAKIIGEAETRLAAIEDQVSRMLERFGAKAT
jgi:cell division septum initiation protein DivIVA